MPMGIVVVILVVLVVVVVVLALALVVVVVIEVVVRGSGLSFPFSILLIVLQFFHCGYARFFISLPLSLSHWFTTGRTIDNFMTFPLSL